MQRLISLFVIITLVSCVAQKNAVKPDYSTTFSPALNTISNAEIGISLASQEKGITYNAIEITKEFQIQLDNIFKTNALGQIFINDHTTNKYDFYKHSSEVTYGIAIPKSGANPIIYTTSNTDGIYTNGFSDFGLNFITPKEDIEYIQTTVRANNKDYFNKNLFIMVVLVMPLNSFIENILMIMPDHLLDKTYSTIYLRVKLLDFVDCELKS